MVDKIVALKLLWPHPLSARYVIAPAGDWLDPHVIAGLSLGAAALAGALISRRRRRVAFLGLGFFAVTWAPVSGIVPTSTLVADRYMYLPALGLAWPLASWITRRLEAGGPAPRFPRALARAALGDDVVDHYLNYARTEQELFDRVVTDWERARLYERG